MIADATPLVAQVQLGRGWIARGSGSIFGANWLHDRRQGYPGSDFTQQFLDGFFELGVRAFAKLSEPQVAFAIQQVLGGPATIGECLPEFVIVVDDDRVVRPNSRMPRSTLLSYCAKVNSGVCTPITARPL